MHINYDQAYIQIFMVMKTEIMVFQVMIFIYIFWQCNWIVCRKSNKVFAYFKPRPCCCATFPAYCWKYVHYILTTNLQWSKNENQWCTRESEMWFVVKSNTSSDNIKFRTSVTIIESGEDAIEPRKGHKSIWT